MNSRYRDIPVIASIMIVGAAAPAAAIPIQANGESTPTSGDKIDTQTESGKRQFAQDQCKGQQPPEIPVDKIPDSRRLSEVVGVYECWQAKVDNDQFFHLNDLYGRWVVELVDDDGDVRDYNKERHSWVSRFFMGRSRGVVTSVRIRMRDPDIEFNLPLVAVDYSGQSKQGEAFVTSLTGSDMSLPDIRLSSNSSVTIEAVARVADEVDIQPTGLVLSAVRDSLAVAAPGGSLLTSINREQVQRVSSAYDAALSRLLSTSITESMSAGRLMSEWFPGASIFVAIYLPEKIRTSRWSSNEELAATIGRRRKLVYRISMTCPRLTVFDVMNACQKGSESRQPFSPDLRTLIRRTDAPTDPGHPGFDGFDYQSAVQLLNKRVSPYQVLNFRLGVGKTLRQYLSDQEGFLTLSKDLLTISADELRVTADFAKKDEASTATFPAESNASKAADRFCAAVFDRLYSAGLSRLDSQIGLWAVVTGVSDFAPYRSVFQRAPVCLDNLPGFGWRYFRAPEKRVDPAKGMTVTKSSSNEGP